MPRVILLFFFFFSQLHSKLYKVILTNLSQASGFYSGFNVTEGVQGLFIACCGAQASLWVSLSKS